MMDEMLSPNHRTDGGVCKVWRMKGRSAVYEFVTLAQSLPGLQPWVIFKRLGWKTIDGPLLKADIPMVYALPADEFHDGRFEPVLGEQ